MNLASILQSWNKAILTFFAQGLELIGWYDGPNFLYFVILAIVVEYLVEKYWIYDDIERLDNEYESRLILIRDRLICLIAYWIFSNQFYTIVGLNFKVLQMYDPTFFDIQRIFYTDNFQFFSFLNETSPLSGTFISIVVYKYVLRRRNGFDTFWLDPTKRMEWHGNLIPPLKHMVRYHWCLCWLFSIYIACITECVDILFFFSYPNSIGIEQWKSFIYVVYYIGTFIFSTGPIFALLGLRPYFPPLHSAIVNQVGIWCPPGCKQPDAFGELDDKFKKFRF